MKRDIFMIQCPQACVQEKVSSVDLDRGGNQLSEVNIKYRKKGRSEGSTQRPSRLEMNWNHLLNLTILMIKTQSPFQGEKLFLNFNN